MTSYQLTNEAHVLRSDGARIPTANSVENPNTNADYLAYRDWLAAGGIPSPAAPLPAEDIQAKLRADLAAEYERRMQVISAPYPPSERESWPIQIQEARALLENAEIAAPWIDTAAAARGLDPIELATRIAAKDEMYRMYHGALTGIRQQIEDAIDAAGDNIADLQAIDVSSGWPAN